MEIKMYSISDLAKILNLHPKTILRFIHEKRIAARKIGRSWMVSEKELKKAPQIVFDTTVFNFEPVKMGTTVKAEFKLANKGKSDLKILKMKAACGCTVAKLDNKTIKRKKEAIIEVEFNTTNRRGNQHKTLTIISNDPKNPVIVLHIQGKVE